MAKLTDEEIRLLIKNNLSESNLFATQEARKAREDASSSFRNISIVISILLSLLAFVGINQITQTSVNRFMQERGVNESLDSLAQKKRVAQSLVDSIRKQYRIATTASEQTVTLASTFPRLINYLEGNDLVSKGESEGWIPVPKSSSQNMEIRLQTNGQSDLFL